MSKKNISLNTLLQFFNYFIFIFSLIVYGQFGDNRYIDYKSIIITLFFCIFIFITLFIEKRRRNPFVVIFTLFILVYYLFRVLTLTMTSFSRSIDLSGTINNYDFNHAYLYIFLSSIFLVIGLFLYPIKKVEDQKLYYINSKYYKVCLLILITLLAITLSNLSPAFLNNPLINYYLRIFPYNTIMLFSIVLILVMNKYSLNKNDSTLLVKVFLFALFVIITLTGGRKFIFNIFLYIIIIKLAIDRTIEFKPKFLLILVILLPISVVLYDVATYLRYFRYENLVLLGNSTNYFELFSKYVSNGFFKTEGLQNVADRLGFLDFTVESITGAEIYKPIINPSYYFKSIIDNITPGFEFFGTPISGQIKQFLYRFGHTVSSTDLLAMDLSREAKYSSQMFSGFGEIYIMFGGMLSFPLFLFIGIFFVKIYNLINSSSIYILILLKSLTLITFYGGQSFLESFGTDWTIQYLFFVAASIIISQSLLRGRTFKQKNYIQN